MFTLSIAPKSRFPDSGRIRADPGCPPETTPLIVVLGPTGSGKSALGMTLARELRGEIVNCDSIQVYRGLDIGSAKVAESEREGIPHHLIDIIDWTEELTAGAYSRLARKSLADIAGRAHLGIVVGGTGFYLRALLDGLSPAPSRDEPLRRRLAAIASRRPGALHRFLTRADPEAAKRIHPNDLQKLIRAVEMTLLARQPATVTQSLPRDPLTGFTILKIGLSPPRDLLYRTLNRRAAEMFELGLLEETNRYLRAGAPPEAKPLQSVGYKQALDVLVRRRPLAEAVAECQLRTRHYAKRQLTWFRAEPEVNWLDGFGSEPAIQSQALTMAKELVRTLG